MYFVAARGYFGSSCQWLGESVLYVCTRLCAEAAAAALMCRNFLFKSPRIRNANRTECINSCIRLRLRYNSDEFPAFLDRAAAAAAVLASPRRFFPSRCLLRSFAFRHERLLSLPLSLPLTLTRGCFFLFINYLLANAIRRKNMLPRARSMILFLARYTLSLSRSYSRGRI